MNKSLSIRRDTESFLTIASPGANSAIFSFRTHEQILFLKSNQNQVVRLSDFFKNIYRDIILMSRNFTFLLSKPVFKNFIIRNFDKYLQK
jgi:hypothetical protein